MTSQLFPLHFDPFPHVVTFLLLSITPVFDKILCIKIRVFKMMVKSKAIDLSFFKSWGLFLDLAANSTASPAQFQSKTIAICVVFPHFSCIIFCSLLV
jgi:hypothetical protein